LNQLDNVLGPYCGNTCFRPRQTKGNKTAATCDKAGC